MELLQETLSFAAKGFVVFLTSVLTVAVIVSLTRRRRASLPRLEVKKLNARFEALGDALRHGMWEPRQLKELLKSRKKGAKPSAGRPHVYVLDFEGDVLATGVTSLREEISAITAVAKPDDEVVVRLESPGASLFFVFFTSAKKTNAPPTVAHM